ncbi:outer membrane beta-barrel protein [Pseudomonas sp. N040]|nr:outer membrane beta-barrel protein [Pseudomonas sp. N040]
MRFSDGLKFTPTLKTEERYDDNIRAVENNVQSSWVTAITPKFVLSTEGRNSAYALTYSLDNETYASSHDDDHTDHHVDADAGFQFDARNKLVLNAGYDKVEDIANDNFEDINNDLLVPQGNNGEPAKYTTANAGGVYTFGAATALTQIELGANYEELRYQNSDGFNEDLERNTTPLRATGYYRVAPKTRLLLEGRHTHFDYINDDDQDSDNKALLGGVTWDATAKTSGTIKVGAERKEFDNSTYDDDDNSMWEAGVKWSPRTYSTFNLTTRQGIAEGDSGASSIDSQTTALAWNHQWLERLSSEVSYSYTDNQYEGTDQQDEIDIFGVGLTYKMRRWLDIGVGYKYATDDSNAPGESYDRNIYAISFTASL